MSSVRKRVFTGTSTAPILMTANIASIHSGRLTIQSATLSPGAMPSGTGIPSPPRRRAASISANVHRRALEGEGLARAPLPGRPLGQASDRLLRVPVAHDGLPDRSGRMGGVYYPGPPVSARAGSREPPSLLGDQQPARASTAASAYSSCSSADAQSRPPSTTATTRRAGTSPIRCPPPAVGQGLDGHDDGVHNARPDREPDQARMRRRVLGRDDEKDAERRVDPDDHHQVVRVPLAPCPPGGPHDPQRVDAEDEDEADDDEHDTKVPNAIRVRAC